MDDFLEKEGTLVPANEEELLQGMEFNPLSAQGYQEKPEEAKPDEFGVLTDEGLTRAINPSPGQSLVDACQLSPEEAEKIKPGDSEGIPGRVFLYPRRIPDRNRAPSR